MVDARGNSQTPLRYTGLTYHNNTVKEFLTNIKFFEENLSSDSNIINSLKIYCRSKDISSVDENNLIYDSNTSNSSKSASNIIYEVMNSTPTINPKRISNLFDIISRNKDYLQKQELYEKIQNNLNKICK